MAPSCKFAPATNALPCGGLSIHFMTAKVSGCSFPEGCCMACDALEKSNFPLGVLGEEKMTPSPGEGPSRATFLATASGKSRLRSA